MSIYGEPDPIEREYTALLKQIEAGHYTGPEEIWEVIQLLTATGDYHHRMWAERLGRYLPKDAC